MISPSLYLAIFLLLPRGLAAAPVAAAWCSLGKNASFVSGRVARGGGDTKREPESKSKRDDGIKSSVMTGANSPSASTPSPWFGANNRDASRRLLMRPERRASRSSEVKTSTRSRDTPKTQEREIGLRYLSTLNTLIPFGTSRTCYQRDS